MRKCISVFAIAVMLMPAAVAQDREKELGRIQAASNVVKEIQAAPDKGIPAEIMSSAQCLAVIPSMLKGGFVVGGNYGKGIATCRHGEQWSAPAPIRIEGGSWGLQIGGQAVDLIMLVMNDKGMNQLLQSKFKVGADVSAAAGPVGRHVEGTTDWKMRAQVLTYSRARGAFAGITLNGAVLRQDDDVTVALYRRMIPFAQILSGSVPAPQGTQTFLADVSKYFRASQGGTAAGGKTTAPPLQSGTAASTTSATAPVAGTTSSAGSAASEAPATSPAGAETPSGSAPTQAGTASATSAPQSSAGTAGAATSVHGTAKETPELSGSAADADVATATSGAGTAAQQPQTAVPEATGTSSQAGAGDNAAQNGMTSADVKSNIEKALRDTPGLSSGGVIINVTQNAVELTGSVSSSADKETVRRIAQQNSGGRKVDDAWLVVR